MKSKSFLHGDVDVLQHSAISSDTTSVVTRGKRLGPYLISAVASRLPGAPACPMARGLLPLSRLSRSREGQPWEDTTHAARRAVPRTGNGGAHVGQKWSTPKPRPA